MKLSVTEQFSGKVLLKTENETFSLFVWVVILDITGS